MNTYRNTVISILRASEIMRINNEAEYKVKQ
jgi:hypothetical protein